MLLIFVIILLRDYKFLSYSLGKVNGSAFKIKILQIVDVHTQKCLSNVKWNDSYTTNTIRFDRFIKEWVASKNYFIQNITIFTLHHICRAAAATSTSSLQPSSSSYAPLLTRTQRDFMHYKHKIKWGKCYIKTPFTRAGFMD